MTEVLDAHAHSWDPAAHPVPWTAGTALDAPMTPDLLDDADGAVTGWIFVESDAAASPLDEVAWVEGLDWPGLRGIVADADLLAPSLRDDLASLGAHPLVCGVRHLLQGLPDGTLADLDLGRGLRAVADAGMAFDACVRWPQLPDLAAALRSSGGCTVVLDHLGKPPVDDGIDSEAGHAWLAGLRAVAEHDGVVVKLSGLRAEASSSDSYRANAPGLLAAAHDLLGPERCLLGSDWPVSTGAVADASMAEWLDLVRGAAGEEGWSRVAAGTAERIYRLA